ncbi:MAG: hypothetical protein HYT82_00350 [Candidatus Harrisonbacteria bacterium]|nr:hypothetical protein [Candidatus Harrisonbacteria bacterium]
MSALLSKKFIVATAIIAITYIIATIYLMNAGLVKDTILGSHSLSYKWNLMTALLAGMWTAMSRISLALLIVVAILTGANLSLIVQRLQKLRSSGGMRFMVGGSSLLGIVGSGCASCGLPILAFLGVGGAVTYLPFQGIELSVLAIILLSLSLYVLIKGYSNKAVCIDLSKSISIQRSRELESIQN